MEQNQLYIESRLARKWTPADVLEIAPGRKVMKVRVNQPHYFNKSDIVLFARSTTSSGYELMGCVYGKTDDGELLIMPLNGFPQYEIPIWISLELLTRDESALSEYYPMQEITESEESEKSEEPEEPEGADTALPEPSPTQEPHDPEGADTALPDAPRLQELEAKHPPQPIAPDKAFYPQAQGYPRRPGEVPDG